MRLGKAFSIWWGPPKEFVTKREDRRVSWLELFYDLVYVIAIARITEHLAHDVSVNGFIENICLFVLVFWGWLNGSLHHDLHGNQGLRTRLMMLWQMMIIAAFAITLDKTHHDYTNVTIVFMIMQLFITYQWLSVGFYDKVHRRYSWPYTIMFLISFGLMAVSLVVPHTWFAVLFPLIVICNYLPPFIAHRLLRRASLDLNLSSSMFERLGLLTIILFGELVLGVVNGISNIETLDFTDWLNFALGISLVFGLWWIFFTMISRREAADGFQKATILELLYIPALLFLGFIAVSFHSFFTEGAMQQLLGLSIAGYLFSIFLIMKLLVYPSVFDTILKPMGMSLLLTAVLFLVISTIKLELSVTWYLVLVGGLITLEIIYLNYVYYKKLLKEDIDPLDV